MIRLRVKELAQAKGLSQARLSRRSDIDLRVIQRLYANPGTNITMITLEKLARALEVEIGELAVLEPPIEKTERKTEQE
jgi:DNA-binding Xre family transcriptional regulator